MITKKNRPMRAIFFRDHEISGLGSRGAQHDHEENRPMRAIFFRDHEISGLGRPARTR
jgi:hypothetical protein